MLPPVSLHPRLPLLFGETPLLAELALKALRGPLYGRGLVQLREIASRLSFLIL